MHVAEPAWIVACRGMKQELYQASVLLLHRPMIFEQNDADIASPCLMKST